MVGLCEGIHEFGRIVCLDYLLLFITFVGDKLMYILLQFLSFYHSKIKD